MSHDWKQVFSQGVPQNSSPIVHVCIYQRSDEFDLGGEEMVGVLFLLSVWDLKVLLLFGVSVVGQFRVLHQLIVDSRH